MPEDTLRRPRPWPRENRRQCYCPRCIGLNKRLTYSTWQEHQDVMQAQAQLQQAQLGNRVVDSDAEVVEEVSSVQVEDILYTDGSPLTDSCDIQNTENSLEDARPTDAVSNDSANNSSVSFTDSESDITDDPDSFDTTDNFGNHFDLHNLEDVDSWNISDPKLKLAIRWFIWKIEARVSDNAFSSRPVLHDENYMSLHNIKQSLQKLTGLSPTRITCCVNVCAAFEDDTANCPHCGEEIYEFIRGSGPQGLMQRPRKQAFYFCPIPRLMLEFALPCSSQEMQEYVAHACSLNDDKEEPVTTDFWTSNHYRCLHAQGYFEDIRDLCLSYTTDGVSITRQRSHSVFPGCLTIHNYAPELRFRRMMIVLLIPGPREAKDMGSFHRPLLASLDRLAQGIGAYDGWQRGRFTMKGHLCFLSGDFPAMAKMTGMRGANAKAPCRFCLITGQYDKQCRHTYYPLDKKQLTKKTQVDLTSEIPLRTNMRQQILRIVASNDKDRWKDYGITSLSWFFDVHTLDFPASFGLDAMHLFSNVAKHMWSLWTGTLLAPDYEDESVSPYCLNSAQQESIGANMRAAARTIPVSVSRTPRDISRHSSSFKATEWFEFILIYSIPLLQDRLPSYALDTWLQFVKGVKLALKVELTMDEVMVLEEHFRTFVVETEAIYYQGLPGRLPVCTSQLHSLLHVASGIRSLGPTYLYWQFGVERYIGILEHLASSKSQQDASIFRGLENLEQLRYIQALYRLESSRTTPIPNSLLIADNVGVIGSFLGPTYKSTLKKHEVRMLGRYYEARYQDSSVDVDATCRLWSRCEREISIGTMNSFQVTASQTHRLRSNGRSRSYIGFQTTTDHGNITEYGEAETLFEHEYRNETHYLAFVGQFEVAEGDGQLRLLRPNTRSTVLISVGSIVEPVGLLESNAIANGRSQTWLVKGWRSLQVS